MYIYIRPTYTYIPMYVVALEWMNAPARNCIEVLQWFMFNQLNNAKIEWNQELESDPLL